MKRFGRNTGIGLVLFALSTTTLWSRIKIPAESVDLPTAAPIIFRGTVLGESPPKAPGFFFEAQALIRVDRWYRGDGSPDVTVHYRKGFEIDGHFCINLRPGTHWIVFATEQNGHLEFFDDCYGALEVSHRIGQSLEPPEMLSQMAADFVAGLEDSNPEGRLASIQRLGNLKLKSSLAALYRVIDQGSTNEKQWATYAAFRIRDPSVWSRVRDLLVRAERDSPTWMLSWELRNISDRRAIPALIEIAQTAPDGIGRSAAMYSLGTNLQAIEALPVIARGLRSSDANVQKSALNDLGVLTQEPACWLFRDTTVQAQIHSCPGARP